MIKVKTLKTRCICARCRRKWAGNGSPARCPKCGQTSFAIVVEERRGRPPK